jgi:hypothetical protein
MPKRSFQNSLTTTGPLVTMTRNFGFHASYLMLVSILAVTYKPHTGAFGFNPNVKFVLIVAGSFAATKRLC